jgi:prepilin-type N-terminal cleavage/methylation domain-containing protein
MNTRGFNLVELIIVVIVIGVLAAIAMPSFRVTQERTYDNEAKANLKLIQAAEKIYRMENTVYWPDNTIGGINSNLRLSLPAGAGRTWNYRTDNVGTAVAEPNSATVTRTWTLSINADDPI